MCRLRGNNKLHFLFRDKWVIKTENYLLYEMTVKYIICFQSNSMYEYGSLDAENFTSFHG